MSQIKGKDTKIEVLVRKALFSDGFRFRKNDNRLPGKPDIVLPKYKTVIFINGCFWHLHANCKNARIPKSNSAFWESKLNKNVENDLKIQDLLIQAGWRVLVVWECELKKSFETTINNIEQELRST